MSMVDELLVGFHELEEAPGGLSPRYRYDSVFEIFLASDATAIYRRFDTQGELKREYDQARSALKKFDGISVCRKHDALILFKSDESGGME